MTIRADLVLQGAWFLGALAAASILDGRKRIIPDSICLLTAAAGLISFSPARLVGILAALPLLIAALIQPDGMGSGDIKLTAAAGFVLGFWPGLWGLALGLLLAVLFSCASAMLRKIACHTDLPRGQAAVPLGPFLSAGFATLYFLTFGGLT